MKFNKKTGLSTGLILAGMMSLASVANATDLGSFTLPYANFSLSDSVAIGAGEVTDYWTFSISSAAIFADIQTSSVSSEVLSVPAFSLLDTTLSGVKLDSVELFAGSIIPTATWVATATIGNSNSSSLPVSIFNGLGTKTDTTTNYTAYWNVNPSLNFINLAAGSYILEVKSTNVGATSPVSYNGALTLSPSAVPLPSAAWFFLTATLGFLGFSRRKSSIG